MMTMQFVVYEMIRTETMTLLVFFHYYIHAAVNHINKIIRKVQPSVLLPSSKLVTVIFI